MNNTTLGVLVTSAPQLRYAGDNQTPICEFNVRIAGLKDEDPPSPDFRAIVWGERGKTAQEDIRSGDRLIIEGSLAMNVVDCPEGFKEKQCEIKINSWCPPEAAIGLPGGGVVASAPTPAAAPPPPAAPAPQALGGGESEGSSPSWDDSPFTFVRYPFIY